MSAKKLSIVIPAYNGAEFLADTLDSILSQGMNDEIEIVICDDVSTDETFEIATKFHESYGDVVKPYKNPVNLGMDKNFEKAVTHATGDYFWFCGQDDIFSQGAVEKVLAVLRTNADIDFVFVNYSHYDQELKTIVVGGDQMIAVDEDVICDNADSFLAATHFILPTFLPAFVLRRSLWDGVDKTPFYGTQYIQLGAFLTLLPKLKTYIIAHPYVKGRVPDDGWQGSQAKKLDVFTGYLQVVTYFYKSNPALYTKSMYKKDFAFCWEIILQIIYQMRMEGLGLNKKLSYRIRKIFKLKYVLFIKLFFIFPQKHVGKLFRPAKMLGF